MKYSIRFNNFFMPYVWIRVPKNLYDWASKTDRMVDTYCARTK